MRKSKEHIKRFLSTVRPSTEKDAERIRQFFSNRKVKVTLTPDDSDDKPRNTITFEQLEAWYTASRPTVGDVIRISSGDLCLVTRELWNSVVVGVSLSPRGELTLAERHVSDGQWSLSSEEDISAFQKALSSHDYDWNSLYYRLEKRNIPTQPKFVRLMILGRPVGVGIFRSVLPDNTLAMYCVMMDGAKIRYQRDLNLGDADAFSMGEVMANRRGILSANGGLIMSMFEWLSYGELPIDTSRPNPIDNTMTIGAEGAESVKTILQWILPALILLGGVLLLIRRKGK